jgi:TolA-binding protein
MAQLLVRVDQLEDQVRQLRGRADELQNQLQQQNADLGKRIDDLKFEIENPEAAAAARKAAAAAAAQAGTPVGGPPQGTLGTLPAGSAPTAPPPAQAPRTPEVAMQQGNAALARRDYPAAEAAARDVLAVRASPRAYDAQFLLAQAQYGGRQYSQAALSYDDTYRRNAKGAHAQDALLGLASSLTSLGDKNSACQALNKLHTEFPNLRADLHEPVAAARQRAGCK